MTYQISRDGQIYGPYTLDDLRRYLASGNVLATDLARSSETEPWMPVSDVLGGVTSTIPERPIAPPFEPGAVYATDDGSLASSRYPDPPSLHWGLVLLFAVFTFGLFETIWALVQSSWMKKVDPTARALYWYIGVGAIFVIAFLAGLGRGLTGTPSGPSVLPLMGGILSIIGRFSLRSSLERHFNGPERVGLALSGVMTFFFGTYYFQYHLTRIQRMKQAARASSGRL